MDILSEKKGLFCKAKSTVSSLYGIMIWSSTLQSSMHIPEQQWPISSQPPGLKTVIYPAKESPYHHHHHPFIIHSYMIPSSSSLSPSLSIPSSSSSLLTNYTSSYSSIWGDLIGTESGVYLDSINDEGLAAARMEKLVAVEQPYYRNLGKRNHGKMTQKLYPPPIPLLARTGNLPGHMPWILTRHYSNGRLILKEEKVKHHDYFEPYRDNGRLILKLVPLDDTIKCCHSGEEEEKQELQELVLIEEEGTQENKEEDQESEDANAEMKIMHDKLIVACASSVPKHCCMENGSKMFGDLRKCFTYAGKMISSCNANAHIDVGGYMVQYQSGSASNLAFSTIPPMTTVV